MNRKELQQISRIRVRESKILLDNGCFSGAYYLLGYAVECALKSCIAKKIMRYDFPDKKLANDSFTHNLEGLITTAGLRSELGNEIKKNKDIAKNWTIVRDWSEQSRYDCNISETKAKDFYKACTVRRHGVLSWLKKYW